MSAPPESAFAKLRPVCVKLSQLTLQLRGGGKADIKELKSALESLHGILREVELNDALWDYVLFPILPIFRHTTTLPSLVVATALQCLHVLLSSGDSITTKPELASQLLVLFMNLLQQQTSLLPKQNAVEQLVLAVCQCLEALLSSGRPAFPDVSSPGVEPRLVITGNLLADLLAVAVSDQVLAARVPSLNAINWLLSYETRVDVLRRFLPGVLSKLARPMFTSSTKRTSYKAIVASLKILSDVLPRALHQDLPGEQHDSKDATATSDGWIAKNMPHVRLVLSNVVKLSSHAKVEVRSSLFDLCESLLKEESTQSEAKLLLDCCVEICGQDDSGREQARLVAILTDRAETRELFLQTTTSALQNLSSKMQSADASKREKAVHVVRACVRLASQLPPGLDDLGELIAESVLECVRLWDTVSSTDVQDAISAEYDFSLVTKADANLNEIFNERSGAQTDAGVVRDLLSTVMSTRFAGSVLDILSDSSQSLYGQAGIARMWSLTTCFNMIDGPKPTEGMPMQMIASHKDAALVGAYDASISLLDKAPLTADWRLQALSLDIIAHYATAAGIDYRPELSFSLYPLVERLACQDERLHRHAASALQRVASACGYEQVQDILLQNADYLVNAVSIRLTDLEPRPEAARVLQAAIRTGGVRMLPHLGDVTECIFSVLDSFHGYPNMVASMFSVLEAMIDVAPVRGEDHPHMRPLRSAAETLTVSDCIEQIRKIGAPKELELEDILSEEVIGDELGLLSGDKDKAVAKTPSNNEKAVTKTVERIVRYSQYYLTYETPQVRRGLLNVLQTGLTALRHDEDVLLPIVNDIWPVMVSRVYDPEPYVSVSALEALTTMIQSAGDFMSTRVEDEWDRLRKFAYQHRPKPRTTNGASGPVAVVSAGDLTYTSSGKIWSALLGTMVAIITHVRVTAGMEADMFALFAKHLHDEKLREALRLLNPDALWLVEEKERVARGQLSELTVPKLEGYRFAPLLV